MLALLLTGSLGAYGAFAFGGLILLVGALGAACVGSALLGPGAHARSTSEQATEALAAATATVMVVVQLLGFAGALHAGAALGTCFALGLACQLIGKRDAHRRLAELARAALRVVAQRGPLPGIWLFACWLVARALSWSDSSWDALTYHLTYPAVWLQERGFTRFEAGGIWDQYESFPKGGEALFYAAMAPLHDDGLVALVNVVLWLGTGMAIKGAAQRLGCSPAASSWCATLVVLCPALSAYVTPAYVEVASAFAFAVALSAGVRAVMAGDSAALISLGLGLGLAAAVKSTGLALWPFGAIAALACARRAPAAACLKHGAIGLGLALLIAGPWYANNALLCGNPFYPAPLPGASAGPAAGSLASAWAIAEGSVMRQDALGIVLDHLAAPPWRVAYPLGPGWLYLLVFPGCFALALGFARGRQAYAAGALGALSLALLLLYLLSPWNGVFPEANTRFLAPSLIAALLGCGVSLSAAPARLRQVLTAIAAAAVLLALGFSHALHAWPESFASFVGFCVFTGVRWGATALARNRPKLDWSMAAVTLLSALIAVPVALVARREGRAAAFSTHTELHPIRPHAKLWAHMNTLPASRVAFAVGGVNSTEGWFFYPLFGSDLRHRVRYVDIEQRDLRACQRRGKLREHPDERAWLARLRSGRYDYLVTDGDPLEQGWAAARPDAFREVLRDGGGRLFAIDRARLP
ncbi:MAG TPA: hypothetical protein VK509_08235 [Polyangiales bacterium]|nr:hypothetical protein [Polyangiales bacterium]